MSAPSQPIHKKTSWHPLVTLIAAIGIYLGGQVLAQLTLVITRHTGLISRSTAAGETVVGQFIFFVLFGIYALTLLCLLLHLKKRTLSSLGLIGRPGLRDIGYAVTGYGVYFVTYFTVFLAAQAFIPSLNTDQQQQIGFKTASGFGELSLVFIALAILPPLIEELLIRGFLYSNLKNRLGRLAATLITSGLFAAAHLPSGTDGAVIWVLGLDTFILSLVLIELKERTGGRLWAPIGLHMIKNTIAFLALFIFAVR